MESGAARPRLSMPGGGCAVGSEDGVEDRADEAQDVADELEHGYDDAEDFHVRPPTVVAGL
jgi:hypothetical protein